MKRLIENYKERFFNRGASQYVGIKIAGLIVLVGILVFILVLIFGEVTASAAELPMAEATCNPLIDIVQTAAEI